MCACAAYTLDIEDVIAGAADLTSLTKSRGLVTLSPIET